MIALLRGSVADQGEDWAVIDTGGVGYLVSASTRTLARLSGEVTLHVETHVREDRIQLYGFAEPEERAWFRLLQTVQGVGGKVALALLSVLTPAELTRAIAAQDRAALGRADGVGPKLAARIAAELKDKTGGIALGPAAALAKAASPAEEDAVSALVNLGYGRSEAFGAVAAALKALGSGAGVDQLIRAGLKELGR